MKVRVGAYAWLPKSELSPAQVASLKSELTIVPRTMVQDEDVEPLRLYAETPDELGLPREFFFRHRRSAHEVVPDWTEGRRDLFTPMGKFRGTLRAEQEQAFHAVTARLSDESRGLGGIVRASPGWGKCLAPDTPVLLHDGRTVRADEVSVGDSLLGPDSRPRSVLSIARGRSRMYRITAKSGDSWVCNADHILTLVHSVTDEVVDIAIEDYLALPASRKHHLKQFTPSGGVDFSSSEDLPIDPYFLGVWFGDGTKALNGVSISKPDPEIYQLCCEIAKEYGLKVRTDYHSSGCPTYHLALKVRGGNTSNRLLTELRDLVGASVAIPLSYKTSSREDRKAFLAGFLDADGHNNSGCLRIIQKRRDYAEDIAFIARSLGIRATVKCKKVGGVSYWRVNMAGDFSQLPMRIARKCPGQRKQRKVATRQGFSIELLPEGPYAGFTLTGDGRFLLGDFTVTHNTVYGISLLSHYNMPTLVLVHRGFLMDQWMERIESFLPDAKVGRVQQNECSYEGASVVLGMVHSVVSGGYPQEFYDWPGLVIVDENHRMGARTWCPAPGLFRAKYRIGITATPRRKDGAENAFYYHIGPILFSAKEQRMRPKIRRVWTKFKLFQTDKFNPKLAPRSLLLRFLLGSKVRNRTIALQLVEAVKAGRKCLVVSEQLKHLATLEEMFLKEWPLDLGFTPGIGYYVGGRTKTQLHEASQAQVIFATSQYSAEGLDIPSLDTLFLTSPLSDVEQVVGRILRPSEGKKDPIVVDFRDDEVKQFQRQGEKRDAYYDKVTA